MPTDEELAHLEQELDEKKERMTELIPEVARLMASNEQLSSELSGEEHPISLPMSSPSERFPSVCFSLYLQLMSDPIHHADEDLDKHLAEDGERVKSLKSQLKDCLAALGDRASGLGCMLDVDKAQLDAVQAQARIIMRGRKRTCMRALDELSQGCGSGASRARLIDQIGVEMSPPPV